MKRILSVILVLISVGTFAQPKEKDLELTKQAAAIKKELALDDKSEHLVYNILYHVKTRIDDIPLGLGNYQKLISYVDEERISMMKSLLPANKYKQYESVFGPVEKKKIASIIAKNAEYVKVHGVVAKKATVADVNDKFATEEDDSSESATTNPQSDGKQ
jgi:hypothetical protein